MLPGFGGMIAGGGGGGGNVTLNGATVSEFGTAVQTTQYRISNDGFVYHGDNGTYTSKYRWTADPVASYEARVTLTAGDSPSGSAVGSWLALSTTCTWSSVDAVADGSSVYCTLTVEIRNATSLAVVATATVTIIAERT